MTKGSPLKLMLQFALPLLMGNLLQQTYNIIDAAIVGQILGADALASVGSSSSVQFLVLGFCIGCCAGFGVPVARYFGAGDHRTMRNYIFNGAVLTAIIAAILMIACSLSCGQILHLLSVPDNIFGNAYAYLIVIFIGIPFSIPVFDYANAQSFRIYFLTHKFPSLRLLFANHNGNMTGSFHDTVCTTHSARFETFQARPLIDKNGAYI